MILNNLDRVPTENFVIENNIIKGVNEECPEFYQIGKLILDTFDSKPDHVIQIEVETGEQITFAEMKENSVRCALWLKKQGIGSGDIVAICCRNHFDAYIPILATFLVGATYNPWLSGQSLHMKKEMQDLIRKFQPKVIFADEETVETIIEAGKAENFSGKIVSIDYRPNLSSLKVLLEQQTSEEVKSFHPQTVSNPEDIAFILMTSGTTGMPKGVPHSYSNFAKLLAMHYNPSPIKGVVLLYSYWNATTGFIYCMQIILRRATRILHRQTDPVEICKVIEKHKVEHFCPLLNFVSSYCKLDLSKKYPLKSLKIVYVGGVKQPEHILDKFQKLLPHASVLHRMGASEIGRSVLSQTENCKVVGSVGFVMSCTEIKISDLETKEALGPDFLGELCVKSTTLIKEYYKDEEITKITIDDEGWFHTCDLAYYNKEGEFFIVDRIKQIMKYQNHQVLPYEIEAVLSSHPDVVEVVVVPIPHEVDGDHPMAFVNKSPGSKVTEEELVKLSEILGETKKLRGGVKFIDELPKLLNGKIDRRALKERAKTLNVH